MLGQSHSNGVEKATESVVFEMFGSERLISPVYDACSKSNNVSNKKNSLAPFFVAESALMGNCVYFGQL